MKSETRTVQSNFKGFACSHPAGMFIQVLITFNIVPSCFKGHETCLRKKNTSVHLIKIASQQTRHLESP